MTTTELAMTLAVVGTEGLPTLETQQQWQEQGEVPTAPLGVVADATAKNTIPHERQSRLVALLTHMEELQMALRVEQHDHRRCSDPSCKS